jgi:flagellar biosynthesis/type III secretory pathway M-ring protein FliF/YscJ
MAEVIVVTPTPTATIVQTTSPYWQWFESVFWVIILIIVLIIVYLIIKEVRIMRNTSKLAEIDLEKEKLNLMKTEMAQRGLPFFRVEPEKLEEIRKLDEENVKLETDIFAKHNVVDKRITRLEDKVKISKLDRLVERIKDEEKKIG